MIETEDDAVQWLESLPIHDAECGRRLQLLVERLHAENSRQNLVSKASLTQVWRRHVADSAQLLLGAQYQAESWIDLGTGAGFPGLVVAVLLPQTAVTLVEVRSRRAKWLSEAVEALGLANVAVCQADVATLPTRKFNIISARAFAPLDRLVPLAARFSTTDTIWLLPKGRSARDELAALSGWRHMFHVEQSLTDVDAGIVTGRLLGAEEQRR